MSDDTFGDWEPDDSHDTEPADPEQVARRLHELREFLAASAGDELAAWDALPDADHELAMLLGGTLIDALTSDAPNAPRTFNEALAFLGNTATWDHLTDDERTVAQSLVDDIIDWLTRQGAMP